MLVVLILAGCGQTPSDDTAPPPPVVAPLPPIPVPAPAAPAPAPETAPETAPAAEQSSHVESTRSESVGAANPSDVSGAPEPVAAQASADVPVEASVEVLADEPYAVVKVYFGTDRAAIASTNSKNRFGPERGTDITYGVTEVSIPRNHKMGEVEAPSIWRFEFREDPNKHVVLLSLDTFEKVGFFTSLKERWSELGESSAIVFIHGYNVTFDSAAKRTAQLSYDLGFKGIPVFYSWPSVGKTAAYTVDQDNIAWSTSNIRLFLGDLLQQPDVDDIVIIAHSMGNRGMTRALTSLIAADHENLNKIREVVLAAPDVDTGQFTRDMAPEFQKLTGGVTLYASAHDKALLASRELHQNARLGDAGANLVVMAGIETIDASNVKTDFLGHSYYGNSESVISDLFYLVRDKKRANTRFGLESQSHHGGGTYWSFR